jgi:hypothetical protein
LRPSKVSNNKKLRIDAQIAELRAMLPGQPVFTPEAPIAKRRPMSARKVKKLDLLESNRGCGLNGLSREEHSKTT